MGKQSSRQKHNLIWTSGTCMQRQIPKEVWEGWVSQHPETWQVFVLLLRNRIWKTVVCKKSLFKAANLAWLPTDYMKFQLYISFSLSYWPKTLVMKTVESWLYKQSANSAVIEVFNRKPTASPASIRKQASEGAIWLRKNPKPNGVLNSRTNNALFPRSFLSMDSPMRKRDKLFPPVN